MRTKPTLDEAKTRLRLDPDLATDLQGAIDQAHARAVKVLDGTLYETEAAMAADPRGILSAEDIIAAQLLLVDCFIGNNTQQERESKESAVLSILRLHRNMGA